MRVGQNAACEEAGATRECHTAEAASSVAILHWCLGMQADLSAADLLRDTLRVHPCSLLRAHLANSEADRLPSTTRSSAAAAETAFITALTWCTARLSV